MRKRKKNKKSTRRREKKIWNGTTVEKKKKMNFHGVMALLWTTQTGMTESQVSLVMLVKKKIEKLDAMSLSPAFVCCLSLAKHHIYIIYIYICIYVPVCTVYIIICTVDKHTDIDLDVKIKWCSYISSAKNYREREIKRCPGVWKENGLLFDFFFFFFRNGFLCFFLKKVSSPLERIWTKMESGLLFLPSVRNFLLCVKCQVYLNYTLYIYTAWYVYRYIYIIFIYGICMCCVFSFKNDIHPIYTHQLKDHLM